MNRNDDKLQQQLRNQVNYNAPVETKSGQVGPSAGPHAHVAAVVVKAPAAEECRVTFRSATMIGTGMGAAISYAAHNYMQKNYASYTNLAQGGKLGLWIAYTAVAAYGMGLYMENRCRTAHGLPKLDMMRDEKKR